MLFLVRATHRANETPRLSFSLLAFPVPGSPSPPPFPNSSFPGDFHELSRARFLESDERRKSASERGEKRERE